MEMFREWAGVVLVLGGMLWLAWKTGGKAFLSILATLFGLIIVAIVLPSPYSDIAKWALVPIGIVLSIGAYAGGKGSVTRSDRGYDDSE